MVRRRTVFSTPFVVVLGCSQPAERPLTPGSGARGSGTQVAAPHDANEESDEEKIARIKAGFMDAQQPCVQSLHNRGPKCNPPEPERWVAHVREGEIININHHADGVFFTVRLGSGYEIDSHWSGVFLKDGQPIAGSEFKIVGKPRGSQVDGFLEGHTDVPSLRVRMTEVER